MGYRFNRLDEPVFMAVTKPLLTEFGIHHRLESCKGPSFELTDKVCWFTNSSHVSLESRVFILLKVLQTHKIRS